MTCLLVVQTFNHCQHTHTSIHWHVTWRIMPSQGTRFLFELTFPDTSMKNWLEISWNHADAIKWFTRLAIRGCCFLGGMEMNEFKVSTACAYRVHEDRTIAARPLPIHPMSTCWLLSGTHYIVYLYRAINHVIITLLDMPHSPWWCHYALFCLGRADFLWLLEKDWCMYVWAHSEV